MLRPLHTRYTMQSIFAMVEDHWFTTRGIVSLVHPVPYVPTRPQSHPVPHPVLEGGVGTYPVEAVSHLIKSAANLWNWHRYEIWAPPILDQIVLMLNTLNHTTPYSHHTGGDTGGGPSGIGIPVWLDNLVPAICICFIISAKLNDDELCPLPANCNRTFFHAIRINNVWPELKSLADLNRAEFAVVRALFHSKPQLQLPPAAASASSSADAAGACASLSPLGEAALPKEPHQGLSAATTCPRSQ